MEKEIVLRDEQLDDICTNLFGNYVDISSTGECINHNFAGAVNVGLLGNSVGILSNQMNSISNSIGNVRNLIDQYSTQMVTFDKEIANKINEIEIPQDFIANNSSQANSYVQFLVSKIDGVSVNNGETTQSINEIDESGINKENLEAMNGDGTVEQNYDDRINIASQVDLSNIIGETAHEYNEIADSSINETNIHDISNEETEKQDYDDSSKISNKEELNDMASDYVQFFDDFDDNLDIEEQKNENINNNQEIINNNIETNNNNNQINY